MDNQEDSVVEEIDVYLSKDEVQQLMLLQYHVRREDMTYDDFGASEARCKPKQNKIELEYPLDVDGTSFSQEKAELFAQNARANNATDGNCLKGEMLDKHTLNSTMSTENTRCSYAVGAFRNGQLHLTSLKAVVSMRPSFTFLNRNDADASSSGVENKTADDSEEEVAKPVIVKFAKRETERAKAARERSFNFLKQKSEEEPWVNLQCAMFRSEESQFQVSKLECVSRDEKSVELDVMPEEYREIIFTKTMRSDPAKPNLPTSDVMFLSSLSSSMVLVDQLQTILIKCNLIRFEQLLEHISNCDPMLIIRNLQQVAVLVQGYWVVRSDVIYPAGSFSCDTSVPAEVLILARDYILWHFVEGLPVVRRTLQNVIKLPDDNVKEILIQMARLSPTRNWVFRYACDNTFIQKYPDVVQRQQVLWKSRYQQLAKAMKLPKLSFKVTDQRKCNRDVVNDRDEHDSLFEKELKDFITETLQRDHCISLSKLKMQLSSKLAQSPPGYVLSRGVSTKSYEKALLEIGAEHVNANWSPDLHQEAIYAMPSMGNDNDRHRCALLDLFRSGPKHRKANIKKKIENDTGDQLSDAILTRLLKEYCQNSKSGYYLLKGVVQQP